MQYQRLLKLNLPKAQSAFLWGARKTGKSTYLRTNYPQSIYYDFLKTDLLLDFSKKPDLLRQQLLAKDTKQLQNPIILDEVQKIPQLLDEVHWLIENKNLSFILCGSSARKLKRGQSNLLGGRAWRFQMLPLVSRELKNIDLIKMLNHGLIPDHYLQENYHKSLQAYVQDYLKEEVFAEGLTRNIPAFSRFFDSMGYSHGQLTNYSNIARECGIDAKTVKEYYQILVDTLLGYFVEPYKKRPSRQIIRSMPKFYLFDVGVASYLCNRTITETRGEAFGQAFEHFIFTEIYAYRSYHDKEFKIRYWRTRSGQEVDFILGDGRVAIEVKGKPQINSFDLHGLQAFQSDYSPEKSILVCQEKTSRTVKEGITITPWKDFLKQLWNGEII